METSEYPNHNPESTLQLLDRIVDTNHRWPDEKLRAILSRISRGNPELATDARFKHLDEYLRRFGA